MTETELMLTAVRRCRRADLYTSDFALTDIEQARFEDMRRRRQNGEPLQYVLGEWEFFGLSFAVNHNVLVPRPETEILVDEVLHSARNMSRRDARILELGTGSGNIAVTLAKFLPQARITTVEISPEALKVAQANAVRHGVAERVNFILGDIKEYLTGDGQRKTFDVIVSNPPYVPTVEIDLLPLDVRQEPVLALDGGADGLDFYRLIIKHGVALLDSRGKMFFEAGDGQVPAVKELFDSARCFGPVKVYKDLAGRERVVSSELLLR